MNKKSKQKTIVATDNLLKIFSFADRKELAALKDFLYANSQMRHKSVNASAFNLISLCKKTPNTALLSFLKQSFTKSKLLCFRNFESLVFDAFLSKTQKSVNASAFNLIKTSLLLKKYNYEN